MMQERLNTPVSERNKRFSGGTRMGPPCGEPVEAVTDLSRHSGNSPR